MKDNSPPLFTNTTLTRNEQIKLVKELLRIARVMGDMRMVGVYEHKLEELDKEHKK